MTAGRLRDNYDGLTDDGEVSARAVNDEKDLDGTTYRGRQNNDQPCYVLFDRIATADPGIVETHEFASMPAIAG